VRRKGVPDVLEGWLVPPSAIDGTLALAALLTGLPQPYPLTHGRGCVAPTLVCFEHTHAPPPSCFTGKVSGDTPAEVIIPRSHQGSLSNQRCQVTTSRE